jgi:dipeptidyl aminopeptidase/acylaminoacyl peptidase
MQAADLVSEKRVEQLFRPPRGERMTLSPDGHYLAYTEHAGGELAIVIMDLERLERKTRIIADEDRPILHSKEKQRTELRFMRWAAGDRLVFAPSIEVIESAAKLPDPEFLARLPADAELPPIPPLLPRILAPVMAVDADGKRPKQLVDAKDFQTMTQDGSALMRAPQIKGFAAGDRAHLLFEIQSVDGGPTELFRLNVETGKHQVVHREVVPDPDYDARSGTRTYKATPAGPVYDWQGRARVYQLPDAGGAGVSAFYRSAESSRWQKFEGPAGAGERIRFTRTPETYFEPRTIPLGFDFDPNVLLVASNVGRDTFGIYGLNLKTWQRTALALEHPRYDLASLNATFPSPALLFDENRQTFAGVRARGVRPFTVWTDPELAQLQRTLDARFPQRTVEISEWNDARTVLLFRVSGGTDPGRIYAYRRDEDRMIELTRSMPWLPTAELHTTNFFEFDGPGGAQLSGFLTFPRTPRLNPAPLVVWFATGMPAQPHPEFDPQAQVFADMGFVVCRLNQRGVLGLGAKHRDALRRDIGGAPAADAVAAIEWIARHHRIDRKRVATFGEGFGGYLAVRATQLHPEAFRCAVTFEPMLDFAAAVEPPPDSEGQPSFSQRVNRIFLEGGGADLRKLSLLAHADQLSTPVFIATRRAPLNAEQSFAAAAVEQLRSQLRRRDIPCVIVDINQDFLVGSPAARTRVYRALEEFFNLNLYNYDVKIGPTRVVR